MAIPTQAALVSDLLDSVEALLIEASSLDPAYVSESYDDNRPADGEPMQIIYRLTDEDPYMYSGAGDQGHHSYIKLEIIIWTRLALDETGRDKYWSRDQSIPQNTAVVPPIPPGRGALIMKLAVLPFFQDQNLFNITTNAPLLIEPMQQVFTPGPSKPDKDDPTLGRSYLNFQLRYIQPTSPS